MVRFTTFGLYSQGVRWANTIVDRGWFGLKPLERHIVICGCPRAGTTLLHLMLTVSLQARSFGRERRATDAAQRALRNHRTLLTKRPNDIFELDAIRDIYKTRLGTPYFLVNIRDPRDVLVSQHSAREGEYYVSLDRWQQIYNAINACRYEQDVLFVVFENLVRNTARVGRDISTFTGLPLVTSMESFLTSVPQGFKATALNGIRPPDLSAIGRWRNEEHRARMKQIITEVPQFTDHLITWGYETDDQWISAFRD